MNATLTEGQKIGNYHVKEFIKTYGLDNVESYTVMDDEGREGIMKLIVEGCSCVEFSENVLDAMSENRNLPCLLESGVETIAGIDYCYIIREKVRGESLSEILDRGVTYSWEDAVVIVLQVMSALRTLHEHGPGVLHNDITPDNVIMDGNSATLIGLSHVSRGSYGRTRYVMKGLNPWYLAPETQRGRFSEKTDVFSVGALLYRMLFGVEPWRSEGQEFTSFDELKDMREFPVMDLCDLHEGKMLTIKQKIILSRMLAPDCDERFGSMRDAFLTLCASLKEGWTGVESVPGLEGAVEESALEEEEGDEVRGFAAVAGLDDVKELLADEVMYVLKNPLKAKQYRLKIPNGMLLYGPPGCGKTFIAERFAQESGLNFMMVKASDLGSIYIHGTQGKISELFTEAGKKSPTVICFDEMDAMVPDRSKINSDGDAGEVNEFLTQLNNCAKKGIFVIGTTNRPNMIDPAVLRSGRMDHLIYIPMPDLEARKELFRLYLADRPVSDDIEVDSLAVASDGFVASDIGLIVNKTALMAAKKDEPISQKMIMEMISITRKSVSEKDKAEYEEMRRQMERKSGNRPRKIGFATGN